LDLDSLNINNSNSNLTIKNVYNDLKIKLNTYLTQINVKLIKQKILKKLLIQIIIDFKKNLINILINQ
jgi:hypothetical protein